MGVAEWITGIEQGLTVEIIVWLVGPVLGWLASRWRIRFYRTSFEKEIADGIREILLRLEQLEKDREGSRDDEGNAA